MTLAAFKEDLAIFLCKVGQSTSTRGIPSNTIENALIQKSKKPNASKPPNQDLHMDRLDHWPIDAPSRSRCKMPGCKDIHVKRVKNVKLDYVLERENLALKNMILPNNIE